MAWCLAKHREHYLYLLWFFCDSPASSSSESDKA